jgi:DNA modification methylase
MFGDQVKPDRSDPADQFDTPKPDDVAVTKHGDVWICCEHNVVCGDATFVEVYDKLLGDERADMIFTDPPYNVANAGHVTKRENVREFAMARGEMSSEQYQQFLSTTCNRLHSRMADGAVAYICIDWRHFVDLWSAATGVFGEPKNTIVWRKHNAGMGSFYRSQHELILVCAAPGKPINNFGLGGKGRHRSNVWDYPGFSGFVRGREEAFAMHPTVKPVAMIMDAMKDCSNRDSIVLDPFGGSGTTMIAAERTKRRARLIEIDPLYCDTIVRRWQKFSGKAARLAGSDDTFDEVAARSSAGRK